MTTVRHDEGSGPPSRRSGNGGRTRSAIATTALLTAAALIMPVGQRDAADPTTLESPAATTIEERPITFSMSVDPGQPVPIELVTMEAAEKLYKEGHRGKGIDVAIVDTGVSLVHGLDQPGKVLYGPDLSNEGGQPGLVNLDTYGHGTHMAGIIAGTDEKLVTGVAPDSRIVSVKVAGATGETSMAQVIAGIDWVIDHRNDNGMNIRVLNLSLGVDGLKTSQGDPLSAAVERAWDAGIVVVAAAGNRGNSSPGIDSPALSPYVVAVAGTESYESSGEKDTIAAWSSAGNEYRTPDVAAPGRSIVSFRVPGSTLDQLHPEAIVEDRYFRGSGTSQSAAVVSGFSAALLSADPSMTPDQVKFLFELFADDIATGDHLDGSGRIDVKQMSEELRYKAKARSQSFPGALPVDSDGGIVAPSGATWSGGQWNGATWSGGTWSGATWSGATWSGATWSGGVWSGATWSGATWSGATWSTGIWNGGVWS